jgi:hypothetical protein
VRKRSRVLVFVGSVILVVALSFPWGGAVALSIWTAWKAPPIARLAPSDLRDLSISPAIGGKLSYFGYEFEVPWSGVKNEASAGPSSILLTYRSGLQLSATALGPNEAINHFAFAGVPVPPNFFQAQFGPDATGSDYELVNSLYYFTPAKMHHWSLSRSVHMRECLLIAIKSSFLLPPAANSGIFRIHNNDFRGFQQGDPQARPAGIVVNLYSNGGDFQFIFSQKEYNNPEGVSQAEINRVIQSLHKVQSR